MASELLGSNLFSSVYKATSESIKAKGQISGDPWDLVMPRLGALCGVQLEPLQAFILDDFRRIAVERTPIAGSQNPCQQRRMKGAGPAVAGLLWLLPAACAGGQSPVPAPAPKELRMSDDVPVTGSFDRNPPRPVAPVERGGKRYGQRLGSHDGGAGQAGGLLDVIDMATGKVEATIKV